MTTSLHLPADTTTVPFHELAAQLTGSLHTPDDAEYAAYTTPWNLAVPMEPAAVVAVRTPEDVAATVRFARRHRCSVGVQATGHGANSAFAGHILVNTRGLDELDVRPDGWVRAGAGVKWLRVIEAAVPLGYMPLNGSTSDVGVVGYLTGGGVGPLTRTYGVAADRVRAFDVVTGDGALRRVTPTEHPDLFFALRGGKGSAAIVTAVEFDMVPLTTFYGGAVYFEADRTAEIVARWNEWSRTLPEEGTTSIAINNLPDMPDIPPPLAGRMTVSVRFAWVGDPAEGERLMDQMRAVAPIALDDCSLRPYTEVDAVHADPVEPLPCVDPAILLREFPAEAAERLVELAGPGSGSPQIMVELRHLGGAYARPGLHPDAFCHREAAYSLLTVGLPGPETLEHAHRVFDAMAAWDTGGIWPNFGPARDERTARRAYDEETLARLVSVVRKYDPDGVLQIGGYAKEIEPTATA